ncbi:MAG: hypothetical protein FWF15_03995 [Oscillospiraceae bacterium]|nr:hypothetical protein [Oscillospiraceae bacterium]
MEYNKYIENFKNPPDEYRPATMWFWTDDLKEDEITFQLKEFKKQGIYDIFVNAVFGINVRYLSDEFFGFVKYAVAECKRLGLRYWIYDEFNWPSGNAGGELLRDYPWAAGKILKLESVVCLPGFTAEKTVRGKLLAAHAVFGNDTVIDVTDKVKIEEAHGIVTVYYNNRYCNTITVNYYFSVPDPHVLTTCVWYKYAGYEPGYIDTFNRAAVDKFIELTHERYKKWVGDEFGKTVMGVFTDEVCLADPFTLGENRLPWSEHFAEKFKDLNGYDIIGHLHGLITPPVTAEQKKVRNDYFNTAKILYLENFIKPMYDWCDENNLKFTGHFDGEESVTWHLMQSADLITSFEYMHIPGIDSIVSAKKINDKNYNVAGKILASISKYYGRERTLCETYTASGWDLRMPIMKKIANRLIMLGVNMIHFMGAYYSWDGIMKTGYTTYPPTHGYNNTLWGHYGKFGDYISGMQYLSAKTKPSSCVLMMIPLIQAKMKLNLAENIFAYLQDGFSVRNIDEVIEGTINEFLRIHIDLDLISEDSAAELIARDGVILYKGDKYKYIILPVMEHISIDIADMIERFEVANVKIIYLDCYPSKIVGSDIELNIKKRNFISINDLKTVFDKSDVMLGMETTGNVLACHRENEDIELVFINNDDTVTNTVSIPDDIRGLVCYEPETKSPKSYYIENDRRIYELVPDETIVAIRNPQIELQNIKIPQTVKVKQILSEDWTFEAVSENVLPLKFPFNSNVPLPTGMEYTICSKFTVNGIIPIINFNCEIRDVNKIYINGNFIDHCVNTRFWGVNNFKTDITNLLIEGENEIRIEAHFPDWPAVHALPFGFLSGDFKVDENDVINPVLDNKINLGPLETQGYKYFTGKGIFKNIFTPLTDYEKVFVNFDNKDILKLSVNGEYVCERMWKPYRAEITDYIGKGENEITFEMTATYANMFGLNSENSLDQVELDYI